MSRSVTALFPHTRDIGSWSDAHARGEVPGRLFYSLEALETHGYALSAQAGDPRPHARLISRLGGGFDWWTPVPDASHSDLLLSWTETAGVPAALRRKRGPVATGVIWMTEPDAYLLPPMRRLAKAGIRRADAVWALSKPQLPVLRDTWGVSASRLHYLPFGIDTDFWQATGDVEVDPELIVSVGNDRHRDFATLVAAMERIRRPVPAARLEVVTASALALGSPRDVRHPSLNHVQIRQLCQRAAVVVVALKPNLHVSGMSVALEAAAMGRPVVISDVPGVNDYVEPGKTGLIAAPNDPGALADAVVSLLQDQPRAAALGAAGAEFVRRTHSADVQASVLADILAQL